MPRAFLSIPISLCVAVTLWLFFRQLASRGPLHRRLPTSIALKWAAGRRTPKAMR